MAAPARLSTRIARRTTAAVLSLTLGLTGLATVVAAPAAVAAPTGPGPVINPTAATVTGDVLPTVQIDGVVWSQVIVGNTVYVGGEFKNARPAGSAPGQNQVPRSNLLAYNLTTGVLVNSFAPAVNAQVKTLAVSPDGKRLYIGGSFTSVAGVARDRVAAFDTATGALVPGFVPHPYSAVNTLAVTNTAVYIGGAFTVANGQPRNRLAAFSASNGALLGWNPAADATVNALVLTPDGSKLIVGGAFQQVNGAAAYGLAAINPASSALVPWKAGSVVRNAGSSAAILSLKTDGTKIYGTGYTFGAGGNLEGAFAADPGTGEVAWVEDCHGDTYDAFPVNGLLYTVSHAHHCGNLGGFPESKPRSANMRHALAFTAEATGTLEHDPHGYFDWFGTPSPSLLNWFPELKVGTYTGITQAAWSVTGNSQYILLGGEFPSVSGKAQQGLVRFAVKPIAPAKVAPKLSGATFPATATGTASGAVRVSWRSNWDIDDATLTYKVVRNGNTAAPVHQVSADATFWNRPTLGFMDTTVVPGTAYTYRIHATDSAGNTVTGDLVRVTAPPAGNGSASPYATAVAGDGAQTHWPLDETAGTVAYDTIGFNDADKGSGVLPGGAGAVDGNAVSTFSGTATGTTGTRGVVAAPNTFTTEAWFKTTSTSGGKIIGFGNAATGSSTGHDRHTYLDNSGRVNFGVRPDTARVVTSSRSYNDGEWHQAVSTLGADGMVLYVDGVRVASRTDTTAGQDYAGHWRVGGDNLSGWPNRPTSAYLQGSIDEVSIYPTVLTQDQVAGHYNATGRTAAGSTPNAVPTATFTSTASGLTVSTDAAASADPDGSVVAYSWAFGNGATGTGVRATHTYPAAGTYPVSLTVTDNRGGKATTTRSVTVTAPPVNAAPTAAFTTSTQGLALSANGSTSADPDGSVTSHAWSFGDGSTGAGATVAHTYAAAGTYTVTLTVTDDRGATGTVARAVIVTAPPAAAGVLASDAFARTTTNGWGTADVGGPWTTSGSLSSFGVSAGTGQLRMAAPGAGPAVFLNQVSATDLTLQADVSLDKVPTGGGTYVTLAARRVGTTDYRLNAILKAGSTAITLTKTVGGTATTLRSATLAGPPYAVGDTLRVSFQVSGTGTTSLSGKVWKLSGVEPTGWQVTTTDSDPALQRPGGVGIQTYLSGSATNAPLVATVDNVSATVVPAA